MLCNIFVFLIIVTQVIHNVSVHVSMSILESASLKASKLKSLSEFVSLTNIDDDGTDDEGGGMPTTESIDSENSDDFLRNNSHIRYCGKLDNPKCEIYTVGEYRLVRTSIDAINEVKNILNPHFIIIESGEVTIEDLLLTTKQREIGVFEGLGRILDEMEVLDKFKTLLLPAIDTISSSVDKFNTVLTLLSVQVLRYKLGDRIYDKLSKSEDIRKKVFENTVLHQFSL